MSSLARMVRSFAPALRAAVQGLFSAGRPATVFGRVRTVVVYAVNGEIGTWSAPHVCNKVLKAVSPPVADSNSAPAVILKGLVVGVVAPLPKCLPNPVFTHRLLAPRSANTRAVSHAGCSAFLSVEATTGLGVPASQVAAYHVHNCSAITSALPPGSSGSAPCRGAIDGQAPKTPADHFNGVGLARPFSMVAAAGLSVAGSKIHSGNLYFCSTVTPTGPVHGAASIRCALNHNQPSAALAQHINSRRHRYTCESTTLSRGLKAKVWPGQAPAGLV